MTDNSNNNENCVLNENNNSVLTITGNSEILTKFSPKIFKTYKQLAFERGIHSYELNARPVSGLGENSYGFILQISLKATPDEKQQKQEQTNNHNKQPKSFVTILKISPKNAAFRAHVRIVDLYRREVFMYEQVFEEFYKLQQERLFELKSVNKDCDNAFNDIVPEIIYASLDLGDEFIICEDLTLSGYKRNSRTNMPTYDLVCATFRSIAIFHAMSFILQQRKPKLFQMLVEQMDDNLFTEDMEPITVEFGKKHIKRTRLMMEQQDNKKPSIKQIEALENLENNFKKICLECVNGKAAKPYAVICHGDFWNNNILYKYDSEQKATSAKLIDFQISRYAAPVLDLVHYLYACTERELRNKHFMQFMDIYHHTLAQHIKYYGHDIAKIYPKTIFLQQLKDFGVYGFCMAAFSIPFFISNTSELPDLDEAASAILDISSTENSDNEENIDTNNGEQQQQQKVAASNATSKRLELLEEYDVLSERTLPIFKRRMCGIVRDLEKYQMLGKI